MNEKSPIYFQDVLHLHHIFQPEECNQYRDMIAQDQRFYFKNSKFISLFPLSHYGDDIEIKDITFVITDIESTGPTFHLDKIIEIAAVKMKDNEIISSFETLVNPNIAIPWFVQKLTQIQTKDVIDKENIETVLPQYLRFLSNDLFVGHNAKFDYGFLNYELFRLELIQKSMPYTVCTLHLAQNLLKEEKQCGLKGLAKKYEYDFGQHHRAMNDVMATTFFLKKFLFMLLEMKIKTLFQLIEQQKNPIGKSKIKTKAEKLKYNYFKKQHKGS